MEFQEVTRRRPTVRSFLDTPLDPDAVERIVECGRRGPSAGFSQGFDFLVLEGREQTQRYRDRCRAPLLIFPLAHEQAYRDRYAEADKGVAGGDWPVPYWLVDTAFAAQLILLSAVDEGLAAVFSAIGDVDAFHRAFGVPAEFFPIGVIAIGHPAP